MRFVRYVGYRLVTALPVIFGIIVLDFLLIHLAPRDAASVLAGESGAATPAHMDELRHKFGLDQSLGMQFLTYVSNMAHSTSATPIATIPTSAACISNDSGRRACSC